MLIPSRFSEADRTAFGAVLEAIEQALDIDGVSGDHRAVLAEMHQWAGRCVGIEPLLTPESQEQAKRARDLLTLLPREPKPLDPELVNKLGLRPASREPDSIETILSRRDREVPMDAYQALFLNSVGPNGICKLGLGISTVEALRDVGVALVADLERLDREGRLRRLRGIGSKRLAEIRSAIARHQATTRGGDGSTR